MIQVGGTITAACAPNEHGSSICCSMKHVTLLWYCRQTEKERKVTHIYILYNTKTHQCIQPERLTACLHQEQLMATISLLWKANFCWNPYRWRSNSVIDFKNLRFHSLALWNVIHVISHTYAETLFFWSILLTFPHCLHLPSCLLRWTQWCRTIAGCHKSKTQDLI